MSGRGAVVYLGRPPGLDERTLGRALRWLGGHFEAQVTRNPRAFARRVREWPRLVLVISGKLSPEMLAQLRALAPEVRAVLVVPQSTRSAAIQTGFPPEAVDWLATGSIARLPRTASGALIHGMLRRCRTTLLESPSLFGDEEVRGALLRAFALPPAAPPRTVKMIAPTDSGRRALDRAWHQFRNGSRVPAPNLAELVRGVAFLRGLWLWTSGMPLQVSARSIGVNRATLRAGFPRYLGVGVRALSIPDLPRRLFTLEARLFGWLEEPVLPMEATK